MQNLCKTKPHKDCREVERRIAAGDDYAALVYEAMALQVGKAIAGLSCTLKGKVDFIRQRRCKTFAKQNPMVSHRAVHVTTINILSLPHDLKVACVTIHHLES